MIFPSNRVRILVATQPVDFRKGRDGLAALVQSVLRKGPFTGTIFVFRAKRPDRLKLLCRDGGGLVMACKRLEGTTYAWPVIKDGMMAGCVPTLGVTGRARSPRRSVARGRW